MSENIKMHSPHQIHCNPFERLDELSVQLPQLRRQLMRIMSREIRDDQ